MSAPASKAESKTDSIPASFTMGGANLLTSALTGQDWSGADVADKIVAGLFIHEKLRPITKKQPPQPTDKASADFYEDWEHSECAITTTEGEREMIRKCLKHESTAKKLPNWYHTAKLYVAFGLDKK